jgi:hypothetical protein
MKLRAVLLVLLMLAGSYQMIYSINDFKEKEFGAVLDPTNHSIDSLLFTKPSTYSSNPITWEINDETEIESLLLFLQDYSVRKLKPEEININDDIDQFSVSLVDSNNNIIKIIVNENLIIQNSLLYYEIVDGPLDVNWIVHFFVSNQI